VAAGQAAGLGPDTLVTIDFVEDGEATLVTFRQEIFDSTRRRS
jgi:hypothetical protein